MKKILILLTTLIFSLTQNIIAQSSTKSYGMQFEQSATLSPGRLTTVMQNKTELTGHSMSGYVYYVSADGKWAMMRTNQQMGDDIILTFNIPALPENILNKRIVANGIIKTLTADKKIMDKYALAGLSKKSGNIVYQYIADGVIVFE